MRPIGVGMWVQRMVLRLRSPGDTPPPIVSSGYTASGVSHTYIGPIVSNAYMSPILPTGYIQYVIPIRYTPSAVPQYQLAIMSVSIKPALLRVYARTSGYGGGLSAVNNYY
jgi:hypothetical protein